MRDSKTNQEHKTDKLSLFYESVETVLASWGETVASYDLVSIMLVVSGYTTAYCCGMNYRPYYAIDAYDCINGNYLWRCPSGYDGCRGEFGYDLLDPNIEPIRVIQEGANRKAIEIAARNNGVNMLCALKIDRREIKEGKNHIEGYNNYITATGLRRKKEV